MNKLLVSFALFARLAIAAEFPIPYNSETNKSSPMPAVEAAATFQLPAGFKATVFASEPDVQNPIAMAWDGRGRLWVAENYTYAEPAKRFDLNLRDRILIFEDKDGDGNFDSRKVFTDEVQMLTSIEVGLGGVWVMCPPKLLFIPDRNRDGLPDSAPEVVLDGFTGATDNYHTFANGLRFGPDGWLYGRCGVSSPGEVGVPGTPPQKRVPLRGTMWRYHPRTKVFEALSSGTTNPWGHDWDANGELFFINTVTGHLWHGITGAHLARLSMVDRNPHAYELIDQHADHWHFDTGKEWRDSRDGKANSYGGGHAHVGMMIYLGDNWPAQYRGHLFTLNLHGRRANEEILERRGSGYVGHHGKDFFISGDDWFRGMDLTYGPDGGVFVSDWSDTGECHEYTGVHRTSGRIFKITYGNPKFPGPIDLAKLSTDDLVKLHSHTNEWFARQARLELVHRENKSNFDSNADRTPRNADFQSAVSQTSGLLRPLPPSATDQLRDVFAKTTDTQIKLRALWSLYGIGAADEKFIITQLHHPNEHIRTWAIRLLSDHWPLDTVNSERPARPEGNVASVLPEFVKLAETDSSGLVRLALCTALQRLPVNQREGLAAALISRKEDAGDHNIPLMVWYGLIPVAENDPSALVTLAGKSQFPTTTRLIARRLAEDIEKRPEPLNQLLGLASTLASEMRSEILTGMSDAFKGCRKAKAPVAWTTFAASVKDSTDSITRDRVRDLNVLFGDGRALESVRQVALDKNADLTSRKAALQAVIDNHPPDMRTICERVLDERYLNSVAARGLAEFNDPALGTKLTRAYRQFHASEHGQLISVLVSRPAFVLPLLTAVSEGKIPRSDISAFHVRQIQSLSDPVLTEKLKSVWGEVKQSEAGKLQLIAKWKQQLSPEKLSQADKSGGRAVFKNTCAGCHTLYGEGGDLGPDLTGGGRSNLDYLLENILDPSAVVAADFKMSIVEVKDGRVLNGVITSKTDRTITIRNATDSLTIERSDISSMRDSSLSVMPDGLLDGLTTEQALDLVAYLMHDQQVSLPDK